MPDNFPQARVAARFSSGLCSMHCGFVVRGRDVPLETPPLPAVAGECEDIEGLEVNHAADLRRLPENTVIISPDDFDRGAVWS